METLLNIGKLLKEEEFNAYVSIANIVDDKEIESLTEIHSILSLTMIRLIQINKDFNENYFYRKKRQAILDNKVVDCFVQVYFESNGTQTSIIVLLQALYKLAVNEKMKLDIYEKNVETKSILKVLLKKGNFAEAYYTLRLIAQLSFSEKISTDLLKDNEFMDILKNFETNFDKKTDDENVNLFKTNCKKLTDEINWNIENLNKTKANLSLIDNQNKNKHIMISYNTGSRELCLKIKEKLESLGYKVWIDVNDIHGSSLDAMAKAVEDSFCVLMCVTEKYRQSVNCQAEAQYAFKLNKKIIPIIMQQGYESVQGWLGIIMGDKIFVNFTKYPFDDCIRRLRKEIDSCISLFGNINANSIVTVNNTDTATVQVQNHTSKQIENWTDDQVKNWFVEKELNLNIFESLKPCNGKIIKQLYEIKCIAPEFYFQSLKEVGNNDLRSITVFTYFLNSLFN